MNLKKRFSIANATAVIIPLIFTVLMALAYVFVSENIYGADISFENYQKVSQLRLELVRSENSILKENPEVLEEKSFQEYLQERLDEFGGEYVLMKNSRVIFSSEDLSKIDIAKCLEAGKTMLGEPIIVNNVAYNIQLIDLTYQDDIKGNMILLVPEDKSATSPTSFLLFIAATFIISFIIANIIVSYRISQSTLNPLSNLQKAASEIRRGNLDYQIVEAGDKEIQELCRDLELMRIRLKDSVHTQLKYDDNRKMLISSISHDLKTPVTSIKGYVEGILDGIANTPEKKERYLKTIHSKARQLDKMIDDLLLYAKLDLNQIPYNFERIDMEEFLKDCIQENEPELERDNIRLEFQNELSQKYHILVDRERMKRVIMNIMENSRKYMNKEQGRIKFGLRETNNSLIIEISDNGEGIKDTDLPHIFDRFYRSDKARSGIKGSGLGLAIAKQVVEDHKGRIWAVANKDEGTSIMISLGKSC